MPSGRAPARRRAVPQPRPGVDLRADRGRRARRLLRGRHRRAACSPVPPTLGGTLECRRSARVRARMGAAAVGPLSRLDGVRAAAERPGHRGADDAADPLALRHARLRSRIGRSAARDHRGEEARLRRHARGTSPIRGWRPFRSSSCSIAEYARRRACRDRSLAGQARSARWRPARARIGYDLSGGGGPRRQRRIAHSEQLRQLRQRDRARRARLRAAEPRRPVHAGSGAPQRPRSAQAPAAHHHPRLHVAGRHAPSPSASWAAGTRRRRTSSSCRTSSTTA